MDTIIIQKYLWPQLWPNLSKDLKFLYDTLSKFCIGVIELFKGKKVEYFKYSAISI